MLSPNGSPDRLPNAGEFDTGEFDTGEFDTGEFDTGAGSNC